jgi:hypothetical protein
MVLYSRNRLMNLVKRPQRMALGNFSFGRDGLQPSDGVL